MRPLNRPMFKMGGPVKEGIMDGIREPKADGGTIGGGAIVGEDKGGGRTGFVDPRLALLTAIGSKARPIFKGVGSFFKSTKPPQFTPAPAGTKTSLLPDFVQRFFVPSARFRQPAIPKDQVIPGKFKPAPLSLKEIVTSPRTLFTAARENPILSTIGLGQIKNLKGIAEGDDELILGKVRNLGVDAVQGTVNYLLGTEFGKEKADLNVKQKGNTVGQRGSDTINQTTEKGNQFNEDGSKKETSVSRLLKAVEKRSRDAAVADSLIAAGEEIRTGGIDSDTVGNITQRVSKEFDKDVDLRQKLDLARIESEFKKEQIREQAIATDPIALDRRKRAQLSINEIRAMDRGGTIYGAKGGAKLLAQEFERNTGVKYQGTLGGDDALKDLKKTDEFKLSPESVIKDSIEKIVQPDGTTGGYNGTYTLGEELYEYLNGVVKKLK